MAINLMKIKEFPACKDFQPSKLVQVIQLCNLLRVSSPSDIQKDGENLNVTFEIDFNSLKSYHGSDHSKAKESIIETVSSVSGVSNVSVNLKSEKVNLTINMSK